MDTNPVETMKAELVEGVALLRPHYPNDTEAELLERARAERPKQYARGRWPTHEELAEQAAQAPSSDDDGPHELEDIAHQARGERGPPTD